MKRFLLFAFLLTAALAAPLPMKAQQTVVTATVKDPNGIPYANGTVQASLQASGRATVTISNQAQCSAASAGTAPCQVPVPGNVGPVAIDSTGTFVMTLYSNTSITPAASKWLFTINISPGIPLPLGTGPQTFSVAVTVTGATQNLSATLSAAAPSLTNFIGPGPGSCPGTAVNPQLFFDNMGACAGVLGSAVTAATGAIVFTSGADTTIPIDLLGHSPTQSAHVLGVSTDGTTPDCATAIGFDTAVCISGVGDTIYQLGIAAPAADVYGANITMALSGGTSTEYFNISRTQGATLQSGGTSLSNTYGGLGAYITLNDDYSIGMYSNNSDSNCWVWFGTSSPVTYSAGVDPCTGNVQSGDKTTGLPPGGGFFSILDAGGVAGHFAHITNPGTLAADYNFAMPITPGTTGYFLTSQGGGTTPMIWTAPPVAFSSIISCGTTAACGNTAVTSPRVVTGTVTTAGGTPTATVTGISPAFTSSASYVCTISINDTFTGGTAQGVTNVSGSSFTLYSSIAGPVNYICIGN